MPPDRHTNDAACEMAPDREEGRSIVWSVSRLAREIQDLLEAEFHGIWVEGEVSNAREHGGHWYFTLKDADAQIDAVFFQRARSRNGALELADPATGLRDGMKVHVYGTVTFYPGRGRIQIMVERLKECGVGALQQAFERLKKKLQAEGLFDVARKRPLPLLPRCVAIVTSPTGAALRDILKVLGRRFPDLHLVIFGVGVQGREAAPGIVEAIDAANELRRSGRYPFDVMIVGRGGGSIEDLWAFNEEIVARAVARSEIPVISAVGHEIDFTICDFVADVRAPTPSAAAEMLVAKREEFDERLRNRARALYTSAQMSTLRWRQALADHHRYLVRHSPRMLFADLRRRLGDRRQTLLRSLERAAWSARQRLTEDELELRQTLHRCLDEWRGRLGTWQARLEALGPEATLRRGYTLTLRENGQLLRSAAEARPGERLTTRLHDGTVRSVVEGPAPGGFPASRRAASRTASEADPQQLSFL